MSLGVMEIDKARLVLGFHTVSSKLGIYHVNLLCKLASHKKSGNSILLEMKEIRGTNSSIPFQLQVKIFGPIEVSFSFCVHSLSYQQIPK